MGFTELVERQIDQGKSIKNNIDAMREVSVPMNNLGDYTAIFTVPRQQPKFDENQVALLKSDIAKWQNVTLDVLRNVFKDNKTYIELFQDTIYDKHYTYNIKGMMNHEVSNGLDVLESAKESISLNLAQTESVPIAAKGQVKVFVSHASADEVIITKFVKKVLSLGLGLTEKDIAYTSEEAYGVEPGENIVKYLEQGINSASVVLLMISHNYKKSEVCLNEMGAAWALKKKCISIVLPGSDFTELGWISSLDKAVKMVEKKKLLSVSKVIADKLGIVLNDHIVSLTSEIDELVTDLKKIKTSITKKTAKQVKAIVKKNPEASLQLFDASFKGIYFTEGEYIIQLDVRMRANGENVSLRHVYLKNKNTFTGSSMNPKKLLEFKSYIHQDIFELTDKAKEADDFLKHYYAGNSRPLLDLIIDNGHNLSVSFVQSFCSVREPDGYDDLQTRGWELVVQYNVDDEVSLPLTLHPLDVDNHRMYWSI